MKYNINITKTKESRLNEVDFENIPFGRVFSDHMFVADYEDGEWINPRIVPFEPFTIHPASMVLHYGQSIFEGMKASKNLDGQPMFFRPEMHAKRLNASASRMCMPDLPEELFLEGLHALVGLDQGWIPPQEGSALYIRPFMFATDEFIGVRPSSKYRFIIFTGPVGPYYSRPVRLVAEQTYVRAVAGGTGEAKTSGNYAASLLPAKIAQEKGYDQVMWMDSREFKYVQEVGTMNIFFVINGKVVTPATDGAILKGITRDTVLTLLKEKGFEVIEKPVHIDEILAAHDRGELEEIFGTGTAAVVSHVAELAYGDRVITLPPIEDRKVSPMIKDWIDGMRSGRVEDTHGWVQEVKSLELVD
ncbi:branched-chain amino acid aminotransferase [Flavilitoribacter nigricans]|uniref:Branched-chain-amino-acid aminotransferase n=1 Tax=Flavilitoribacter nigricans (strain ATCC 23147 / DSM 23189 / NBRC 102662 / NCIMB 1420 / SS-2) TaxID=1122177 RepID=A0A2D0NC05_FLAN2|nr:branched-chain amino acid aminotransferase [Flavilitoribacter nigricans]PHN05303.1 branched chain amino acid aminotransferase [Flavilitoribacter nigricans DSM 23189 = NBRC 102662]